MRTAGVTLDPEAIGTLIQRFGCPPAAGLMLMGSRAQGSAGPYSDVDLVRLVDEGTLRDQPPRDGDCADGTHWVGDWLVVASTVTPANLEQMFTDPEAACHGVTGLRTAQLLKDPDGRLRTYQRRAREFVWDTALQSRANRWAGQQLVGWIEEAYKGMEGLRRNDTGRMLNAVFGLSWGLSRVMIVQRGVLLGSDNDHWEAVNLAVGLHSRWVDLRHAAFGLVDQSDGGSRLRGQVMAGLHLYLETVALIGPALPAPENGAIRQAAARIEHFLTDHEHDSPTR